MTFARKYERPARVFPTPVPQDMRRGVLSVVADTVAAQPKTTALRNPHLLAMAEGKPCLVRVPALCRGGTETTVAAHSNLLRHGKGKGRKADDCYSVWACARCHTWLDSSYTAEFEEKCIAFEFAHAFQVQEWREIANDESAKPKDRAAAKWALDALNVTLERLMA
jgi:hypothetical protein